MKKSLLIALIALATTFGMSRQVFAVGACSGDKNPMRIITRDADGVLLPDMNFTVYEQKTNPDGGFYFGTSLASGKTDAGGQSPIQCLDPKKEPYAVKVYEHNATYGYSTIWSTAIPKEGLTFTAEVKMGYLYSLFRDPEGTVIKNQKFDIYIQSFDVNNQPIIDETKLNVDKLVKANYTTGDFGAKRAYLAAGNYVVRVHATGGKQYFYVWNQEVKNAEVTTLDYKLSALRTILEDGLGNLVKNKKFSIYTQKYDVRNKPILGDLVASDLDTGAEGKKDAYIPAGTYALKIPASYAGAAYNVWKLGVTSQELATTTYRLSGFRIIIREGGALVRNAKFSVATQKLDALGKPVVDTIVLKDQSTGEAGYLDVYLTPGTYVLIYGDKKLFQLDAFENQFTTVDWPRVISVRPREEVALSNPFKNTNLTLRPRSMPKISLKSVKTTLSKAYEIQSQTIAKPFTVTFYYTDAKLEKKNVSSSSVRIAFYNASTGKWQYVGKNSPTKRQAQVNTKHKGIFVLVARK